MGKDYILGYYSKKPEEDDGTRWEVFDPDLIRELVTEEMENLT